MSESPFREDLVSLLESIAGSDWHRQTNDIASARTRPDPSGRIFQALFSIDEIQEIQDAFARATGVASIITRTDGVPLTQPSNFCDLCQNIIRKTEKGLKNCFHSDADIGRHNPEGPVIQTCLSGGLWDAGASITAGRIHIANWLIGQVMNEETDRDRMLNYAREIGADEEAFLAALENVTVMSTEQFRQVSRTLFLMANQMSQRAFQNLQLTHTISELGRTEGIISRSPAVAFRWKREPGWPVAFVTQNVERLFGYTAEDFVSGRVSYKNAIHPDDADRVREELRRNILDRGIREFTYEPYRILTRSGDVKWVEDITSLIRNPQGEVTAFDGIVIEITERMEMEREKAALESQLQHAQKMELVGTLAGGVAHDLNNILGAIVAYPDLLLMDLPEDSPLREPIEQISLSGQRAADIVQDLLTLARRGVMVKEVIHLNTVVSDYLESPDHRKLAVSHPQVVTETDLEEDLLNIQGSPAHLSKILMNLVTNAAEAMPHGGTVRISTENVYLDRGRAEHDNVKEGDYVVLRISDQGTGISSRDRERIFEPFYTRKEMGASGTGLGMAVVWGTVKDHEGHISVQSGRAGGTTFHIYFPITRKEAPEAPGTLTVEDYQGRGEKILVIDDVDEQREIASALLSRLGYAVSTAASGREALDHLETKPADLLLLDMIMDPGWDGLETFRKILERHPGQKAIIASGFSETGRVREAQKLGAGLYIKKPYTLAKLGLAVRDELAGQRG